MITLIILSLLVIAALAAILLVGAGGGLFIVLLAVLLLGLTVILGAPGLLVGVDIALGILIIVKLFKALFRR